MQFYRTGAFILFHGRIEIGRGYDKGLRGPYDPAARDFIPCIPAGEPA